MVEDASNKEVGLGSFLSFKVGKWLAMALQVRFFFVLFLLSRNTDLCPL